MENQIFIASAGMIGKSILLKENEIWVHTNKVESLEQFEKDILKTGMKATAYKIVLASVDQISFNEASESAKINYTNEKGKQKKLKIDFGDTAISNQFGEYLGEKLGLNRSSTQESQIKPLLVNGFYLALAIFATIGFGTMEDTSELVNSGRRRGKFGGVVAKYVIDTIGQTGVFIIGSLISLFCAYQLYKRFKNPSSVILYAK